MSVVSHIEHLQARHAHFEAQLSDEMSHPLPDFFTIKEIKKQKLLIKEEINRLSHQLEPMREDAS